MNSNSLPGFIQLDSSPFYKNEASEKVSEHYEGTPIHFHKTYLNLNERSTIETFWVYESPDGAIEIKDITGNSHINYVINNPRDFGISLPEIEKVYTQYNEPIGLEGNAREDIIRDLTKKGFIRIRHYNGSTNYWSIQCDDIAKRTKKIKAFIYWAIKYKHMSYQDSLEIIGLNGGKGNDLRVPYQKGGASAALQELPL